MLDEICTPCDPVEEMFVPKELPAQVCDPCLIPEPPKVDPLLPVIEKEVIVTSCLVPALNAMFTQFYCETGPKGCK